jgi:hypothetical protein
MLPLNTNKKYIKMTKLKSANDEEDDWKIAENLMNKYIIA